VNKVALIEVGRVCIKTKGRLAGKKCVVIGIEKGFAIVAGEREKKRKCNFTHLFPTSHKIHVSKDSSQEEIIKHLKGVKLNG